MFCERCGSSIPDGNAFCTKCGCPAPQGAQSANAYSSTLSLISIPVTTQKDLKVQKGDTGSPDSPFVFHSKSTFINSLCSQVQQSWPRSPTNNQLYSTIL